MEYQLVTIMVFSCFDAFK